LETAPEQKSLVLQLAARSMRPFGPILLPWSLALLHLPLLRRVPLLHLLRLLSVALLHLLFLRVVVILGRLLLLQLLVLLVLESRS
jgi:hypothetical protein